MFIFEIMQMGNKIEPKLEWAMKLEKNQASFAEVKSYNTNSPVDTKQCAESRM